MFEPLKNIDAFSKVAVDPKLETVVWPNGADLAPEYLKELHQANQQGLKTVCCFRTSLSLSTLLDA